MLGVLLGAILYQVLQKHGHDQPLLQDARTSFARLRACTTAGNCRLGNHAVRPLVVCPDAGRFPSKQSATD
jgi:hypothetical protein